MNEQQGCDATYGSAVQDNFAALNQVMIDQERRKRREKKKKKKNHRRPSTSSHSNGIREDANPQDKSTAVEAASGVLESTENQEAASIMPPDNNFDVKYDEVEATDSTARPRDKKKGTKQGQKKSTTVEAASGVRASTEKQEASPILQPDPPDYGYGIKYDEVAATDSTAQLRKRKKGTPEERKNMMSSQDYDVENSITAISSYEKDAFLRSSNSSKSHEYADNDSNEGMIEIPHDSFSMFYAARGCFDHVLPFCVFLLQITILILIAVNLLQENDKPLSNTMNVPVDVPMTVTMSQYIACFVSVFTAEDFITGVLYAGKQILNDESVSPSRWKWEVSNLMRMTEGALVIFVSFIFIIQSYTAIDLFLNFAGVAFVGTLDDVSFAMAKNGFLGKRSLNLARRVSEMRAHHDISREHAHRIGNIEVGRYVLFAGLAILMWSGLSAFVIMQDNEHFACRSVTVEVGDTRYAWARHYSGMYSIKLQSFGQRATYVKDEGKYEGARIAYCSNKRWVITHGFVSNEDCGEYSLMSERTRTHDISEVGEFRFWTGEVSGVEVRCADCNPSKNRREETCGFQGKCQEDRKCKCDAHHFGPRCQYKGPCTEVVMHDSFRGSKNATSDSFPKSFQLMYDQNDPLYWMGYPVYGQEETSRYIHYDGARWNVIKGEFNNTDFSSYLDCGLNCTLYISDPSISGSPVNLAFRAMLAIAEGDDDTFEGGTEPGRLGEKEFYFSCADCISEDSNETLGISHCTDIHGKTDKSICEVEINPLHGEVNRCNCKPGFMGPLCHIRPAEGQVLLHLDQSGEGFCHMCGGETNDWSLWKLDGIRTTCLPVPKKPLTFKGTKGTFSRQVGLNLNETHFSIFVSNNTSVGGDELQLCRPDVGNVEIYSTLRNSSSEQIHHDYAIQLDDNATYFGDIVDPEEVECKKETNVDQHECDAIGNLKKAWIQLDMKTTPFW